MAAAGFNTSKIRSVKIVYDDEIRRVRVVDLSSFDLPDLKSLVLRKFSKRGLKKRSYLRFTFVDDEGDVCSITNNDELSEAFRCVKTPKIFVSKVVEDEIEKDSTKKEVAEFEDEIEIDEDFSKEFIAHLDDEIERDSSKKDVSDLEDKIEIECDSVEDIDPDALKWMLNRLETFEENKNKNNNNNNNKSKEKRLKKTFDSSDESTSFLPTTTEEPHFELKNQVLNFVKKADKYVTNVTRKIDKIVDRMKKKHGGEVKYLQHVSSDLVRDARSVGSKMQRKILKLGRKQGNAVYGSLFNKEKHVADIDFKTVLRNAVQSAKQDVREVKNKARQVVKKAKEVARRNKGKFCVKEEDTTTTTASSDSGSENEVVAHAKVTAKMMRRNAREIKEVRLAKARQSAKLARRSRVKIARSQADRARLKILEAARLEGRKIRKSILQGVRAASKRLQAELQHLSGEVSASEDEGSIDRAEQLEKIVEMGFSDRDTVSDALKVSNGDIGRAITILLTRDE